MFKGEIVLSKELKRWERRPSETFMDYEERLYRNRKTYDLTWSEITELLGLEQHADTTRKESYGYIRRIGQERRSSKDNSIMIMNDIHLPFERPDVLDMIRKHKDEITALVFAGDLMDCFAISPFPKIEHLNFVEEVKYTHAFLQEVRSILDDGQEIIIINGNHEERWTQEIKRMNRKNLQMFINPNLLEIIIKGFNLYVENGVEVFEPINGITYIPHWFVNIDNKLIIAHPKNFSQVDGKMCENVTAHFINRGEEFDIAVFGHTHKYSEMTVSRRGGKYAVENGCMCQPMEYADSGKLNYTPQHYCYTIVHYDDDKPFNYNDVTVYHLDADVVQGDEEFLVSLSDGEKVG